jgi:hypothetical protein
LEEEAGAGGKFACGGSSTARGAQSSSSAMAADERREKGKLKTSRIRGRVCFGFWTFENDRKVKMGFLHLPFPPFLMFCYLLPY